jgi:hypothetical protein
VRVDGRFDRQLFDLDGVLGGKIHDWPFVMSAR